MNVMTRCHEKTGPIIDKISLFFPFFHTFEKDKENKSSCNLVSKIYKTFFVNFLNFTATVLVLLMNWKEN